MLSVLIPIYNCDVVNLVDDLIAQCEQAGIEYEIICLDDCSTRKWKAKNEALTHKFKVNYVQLSENLGRARIRNWMTKLASKSYLLFLDSDSKLPDKQFINRYLEKLEEGHRGVLCGGRIYKSTKPRTHDKMIHWSYGHTYESKSAKERNHHSFRYFHSNNFLVSSSILADHPFDESLTTYGYEDLLWAYQVHQKSHEILHIENPVIHLNIERNAAFMDKTLQAIDNLLFIEHEHGIDLTRLQSVASRLMTFKMDKIFLFLLRNKARDWKNSFLEGGWNGRKFQLWKLYQYLKKKKDLAERSF